MKIALAQMDIAWLDVQANLNKIRGFIDDAEAQGARLLVLPEMALTGFCMDAPSATLGVGSPELNALARMTRGKELMVFVGAAMKTNTARGQRYTNDCLVVRRGEIIASYSKMNLFTVTGEEKNYVPGTQMLTVELDGFKITPLICFDTRFVEPFAAGAANGTDAFVIIASWPVAASRQWKTLLSARATDTQAYVIGVNRIGDGGGLSFAGECMIVSPSGKPLFEYSSDEKLMLAEVDLSYARQMREKFPVLAGQFQNRKTIPIETKVIR